MCVLCFELLRDMSYAFVCFCLWLLDDFKLSDALSQNQNSSPSIVNDVSVVYTDETQTISVMEGDSVTLNTAVTEIQRDDQILWIFKLQNSDTCIAEIYKQIIFIYDNKEYNERFRSRLQMDNQTGSLTITNINKLHSGLYKLQIINGGIKYKSFNLAVYAPLTVPVISDSPQIPSVSERSSGQNCSLLCSVVNVRNVTLSWIKGNSLLSSISVSDLSISLSLPLEIKCLDDSYSCVVAYSFTNQTKHLNITQFCRPCSDDGRIKHVMIAVVILLLLLLVISASVVLMFYRSRSNKDSAQEIWTTEEVEYTDPMFTTHRDQDSETSGQNQTEYSEVALR